MSKFPLVIISLSISPDGQKPTNKDFSCLTPGIKETIDFFKALLKTLQN